MKIKNETIQRVGLLCFPVLCVYMLGYFGVSLPVWFLMFVIALWGVVFFVYTYLDRQHILRVHYPRWVYFGVALILFLMLVTQGFSHQFVFLLLLFLRGMTLWRYDVWIYIVLVYAVLFLVMDSYQYFAQAYVLLPFLYKYVTVLLIARIGEYILFSSSFVNVGESEAGIIKKDVF